MPAFKRPASKQRVSKAKKEKAQKQEEEEDENESQVELPQQKPEGDREDVDDASKAEEKSNHDNKQDDYEQARSELSKSESLSQKLETLKLDLLNKSLTTKEWNVLNGRFATARNKSSDLQALALQNPGNKNHRNFVAALSLDPSMSDVWQQLVHPVKGTQSLQKTDEWVSWKKLERDWTEEETMAHLASGRFSQRECVDTANVWEYKDNKKMKSVKSLDRPKEVQRSSKQQLKPEQKETDEEDWASAWAAYGSASSFNDVHPFSSNISKGFCKGDGKTSLPDNRKGKGKGKGSKDELNMDDKVDKKKVTALKSMIHKQILMLGNKGFEATDDKVKDDVQNAKKNMSQFMDMLPEAEGWTNKKHQEIMKQVATQVEFNKKKFGF